MNLNFIVILLVIKMFAVDCLIRDFQETLTQNAELFTEILNQKLQLLQRNVERESFESCDNT